MTNKIVRITPVDHNHPDDYYGEYEVHLDGCDETTRVRGHFRRYEKPRFWLDAREYANGKWYYEQDDDCLWLTHETYKKINFLVEKSIVDGG